MAYLSKVGGQDKHLLHFFVPDLHSRIRGTEKVMSIFAHFLTHSERGVEGGVRHVEGSDGEVHSS